MTIQELLDSLPLDGIDTRNGPKCVAKFMMFHDLATEKKHLLFQQGNEKWRTLVETLAADLEYNPGRGTFYNKFLDENRETVIGDLPQGVVKVETAERPASIEFWHRGTHIRVVYGAENRGETHSVWVE
jgi:hypothetical protein